MLVLEVFRLEGFNKHPWLYNATNVIQLFITRIRVLIWIHYYSIFLWMSWVIQNNEITNLAVCIDKGYHSYWIQHLCDKVRQYGFNNIG
jgi:hypothetical protein